MRLLSLLVVLVVTVSACETAVAPRSGADRHFSLYGVVNPLADSQGVVVFPIEDELRNLPGAPLSVRVSSLDLQSGESRIWRDSIVTRADGAMHVFWSPFRAQFDRSYRLEVESLDNDERSEVTVTVPPLAEIVPGPPRQDFGFEQDLAVTAPVGRLNFLLVRYVIRAKLPPASQLYPVLTPDKLAGLGDPPPTSDPVPPTNPDSLVVQTLFVPIDYAERARVDGAGWTIPVNLSDDFREIRQRVSRRGNSDASYGIRLDRIEVSLVAANAEWTAPGDRFDAEILIQPGTMSNVHGGFGFVGAGYRLEHAYTIPDDIKIQIGYRTDQN